MKMDYLNQLMDRFERLSEKASKTVKEEGFLMSYVLEEIEKNLSILQTSSMRNRILYQIVIMQIHGMEKYFSEDMEIDLDDLTEILKNSKFNKGNKRFYDNLVNVADKKPYAFILCVLVNPFFLFEKEDDGNRTDFELIRTIFGSIIKDDKNIQFVKYNFSKHFDLLKRYIKNLDDQLLKKSFGMVAQDSISGQIVGILLLNKSEEKSHVITVFWSDFSMEMPRKRIKMRLLSKLLKENKHDVIYKTPKTFNDYEEENPSILKDYGFIEMDNSLVLKPSKPSRSGMSMIQSKPIKKKLKHDYINKLIREDEIRISLLKEEIEELKNTLELPKHYQYENEEETMSEKKDDLNTFDDRMLVNKSNELYERLKSFLTDEKYKSTRKYTKEFILINEEYWNTNNEYTFYLNFDMEDELTLAFIKLVKEKFDIKIINSTPLRTFIAKKENIEAFTTLMDWIGLGLIVNMGDIMVIDIIYTEYGFKADWNHDLEKNENNTVIEYKVDENGIPIGKFSKAHLGKTSESDFNIKIAFKRIVKTINEKNTLEYLLLVYTPKDDKNDSYEKEVALKIKELKNSEKELSDEQIKNYLNFIIDINSKYFKDNGLDIDAKIQLTKIINALKLVYDLTKYLKDDITKNDIINDRENLMNSVKEVYGEDSGAYLLVDCITDDSFTIDNDILGSFKEVNPTYDKTLNVDVNEETLRKDIYTYFKTADAKKRKNETENLEKNKVQRIENEVFEINEKIDSTQKEENKIKISLNVVENKVEENKELIKNVKDEQERIKKEGEMAEQERIRKEEEERIKQEVEKRRREQEEVEREKERILEIERKVKEEAEKEKQKILEMKRIEKEQKLEKLSERNKKLELLNDELEKIKKGDEKFISICEENIKNLKETKIELTDTLEKNKKKILSPPTDNENFDRKKLRDENRLINITIIENDDEINANEEFIRNRKEDTKKENKIKEIDELKKEIENLENELKQNENNEEELIKIPVEGLINIDKKIEDIIEENLSDTFKVEKVKEKEITPFDNYEDIIEFSKKNFPNKDDLKVKNILLKE